MKSARPASSATVRTYTTRWDTIYDEQVVLLKGTATLTSLDGKVEVFHAGDVFIAPKGWSGTWELSGGYRELICFESKSLDYAMKKWFS